jgi:prepilin-type N-terminal cleavage/methylation domain-containing protein
MRNTDSNRGFTIVELLIVIVVIAILAGITIVAFNGIQARAKSAQLQSALDTYVKAIRLHEAEHGIFPNILGYACLGKAADYPATSQFPAGACVADATTNAAVYSVSSTFNSAIAAYISNTPVLNTSTVTAYGGWLYRGAYVYIESGRFEIEIALPGSQSCPSNFREYDLAGGVHWCQKDNYW